MKKIIVSNDAIVEIENIVRHMRMGKSAYQASIDAADEIGLAVVATTFSIVAVFLPVSLMPGVSGQFFKNFGLLLALLALPETFGPILLKQKAQHLRNLTNDIRFTAPIQAGDVLEATGSVTSRGGLSACQDQPAGTFRMTTATRATVPTPATGSSSPSSCWRRSPRRWRSTVRRYSWRPRSASPAARTTPPRSRN